MIVKINNVVRNVYAPFLLIVGCGFLGATQLHAQAQYGGIKISNGNLKGDLARCQKASTSTQNWLKIGTNIIQGAVTSAGGNNFQANIAAGNQVGQQIAAQGIRELSGLVCGKACKDRLRKKATDSVGKLIGKQAAGSLLPSTVPSNDDALKEAVLAGNEERQQDDATRAAAVDNREVCVNALAKFGIQNALMALQAKTLDFVNKGNGGVPFYLQDPESYFNTMYKDILKKNLSGGVNLSITGRSDADTQLNDAVNKVIIGQITGKDPSFVNQGFDSLKSGGVSTSNWNTFLGSSFGSGAMGTYLSKIDSINREYSDSKNYADQEILRNRGFLDQKICAKYGTPDPETNEKKCLAYTTVTPGSVLADQVTSVFSSKFQSLANASGLSDQIALGFTSFVDSLMQRGLSNIGKNDRTYEYALGGANSGGQFNYKQFSSQYLNTSVGGTGNTNTADDVTQDANGAKLDTDFDVSHTTTLAAILRTQNTFLNTSKDSINANRKLVAEMGALDYCVPGPNPAWLSYAYQNQTELNGAVQGGQGYQADSSDLSKKFKNETFTTDRYGFTDPVTDSIIPYKSKIFKINPPHAPIKQSEKAGSGNAIVDYACGIGSAIVNIFGGDTSCDHTESWLEADPTASNVVADAFTQWFAQYSQDMLDAYSNSKLTIAFSIADADYAAKHPGYTPLSQPFIKARVRSMINKTNALVDYNQQLTENINDYDESIDKATEVQAKMESIYNRALAIVKVARARHIATQLAQGVVVNQQCLDKNFSVSESTAGVPQKETDADADATVIQSQFAKDTFYDNLCKLIPGTNIPECTPPLIQSGTQYPFIAQVDNLPECSSDTLSADFNNAVTSAGNVKVSIKSLGALPAGYTVSVSRKVYADIYASEQNRQMDGGVELPGLDLRYTMAISDAYRPKYIRGVLNEASTKKIKTTTNIAGVGNAFLNSLVTIVPGSGSYSNPSSPFATQYCDNSTNKDTYFNAGMLNSGKNADGDPILWTRKPFNPETGAQSSIFRSLGTDTGEQHSYVYETYNQVFGGSAGNNAKPVYENMLSNAKVFWSDTVLPIGKSITALSGGTGTVLSSKRAYCTIGLNRTIGLPSNETNGGGSPSGEVFAKAPLPAGGIIYDNATGTSKANALPAAYETSREYRTYGEDASGSKSGYRNRTFSIFNHAVEVAVPKRINYIIKVYNQYGGLVSTSNAAVALDDFYLQDTDKVQAGTLLRRIDAGQTIMEKETPLNIGGSDKSGIRKSAIGLCRK